MPDTRQVNLRLSPEHAQLVRLFVQRLREGGPSFEREVGLFLLHPYTPDYMTINELDRQFGEILRASRRWKPRYMVLRGGRGLRGRISHPMCRGTLKNPIWTASTHLSASPIAWR